MKHFAHAFVRNNGGFSQAKWRGPQRLQPGALTAMVAAAVALALAPTVLMAAGDSPPNSQGAAGYVVRPISFGSNTLTQADIQKKRKAFRTRQFADAYQQNGPHDQPWDADARQFIRAWIDCDFGAEGTNDLKGPRRLADKLAANSACHDPVVLLLAASASSTEDEMARRCERALAAFADTKYKAYPKLCATLEMTQHVGDQAAQVEELERSALALFQESLHDGSLREEDQPAVADSLLEDWPGGFFWRHEQRLVTLADQAGAAFHWLALVLKGQHEINAAWRARGGGLANTVTPEGWKGLAEHLALARTNLTEAWTLHPEWPQAASRMVIVAMGQTNGADPEVRLWFDRATSAQLDYPPAWRNMRAALLPRWGGNFDMMGDLGVAAVETGRFDTDVPKQFFEIVGELEIEANLKPGSHLYGQSNVWPVLKPMYEGYIAQASRQGPSDLSWRGTYAVVSYLAGDYGVAREQLEKLRWTIEPSVLRGASADLSLLPLEIAARTGPSSNAIAAAEEARAADHLEDSLKLYQECSTHSADARTQQFIRHRLASLQLERQLKPDRWIDFLPKDTNDLNWISSGGRWSVLPGGGVELHAGTNVSLLMSQVRVGANFEIKGEFEVAPSTTKDFQAGIAIGLPQIGGSNCFIFYLKRRAKADDVAYAQDWSTNGTVKPFPLKDIRNSFTFQLRDGKAMATVNGLRAFARVPDPGGIWVADRDFLLALGACNEGNETVIRYRNIQVRRLASDAGSVK
jgi:hypothetical protein